MCLLTWGFLGFFRFLRLCCFEVEAPVDLKVVDRRLVNFGRMGSDWGRFLRRGCNRLQIVGLHQARYWDERELHNGPERPMDSAWNLRKRCARGIGGSWIGIVFFFFLWFSCSRVPMVIIHAFVDSVLHRRQIACDQM